MDDNHIPGLGKLTRENRKTDDERVVYLTVLGLLCVPVVALYLATQLA